MPSFRCANPDCNDLLMPVLDEHGRLSPNHFRCTNPSCTKPTDIVMRPASPGSRLPDGQHLHIDVRQGDPRRQERGL